MPWIPKKDALRRFREASGYSIYDLAHRVGISERQIRTIESETPPGSILSRTVQSLAKALGCSKEELATWIARKPAPAPVESPSGEHGDIPGQEPKTIEGLAAMERHARLAGEFGSLQIETSGGTFELLGAERSLEIDAQYGAFEGQPFLVVGRVEHHKPLPPAAAKVLGAKSGVGGRFQITRALFYEIAFGASVLTATAELTRLLLEKHRQGATADVVVRVVVERPRKSWKGFVGLGSDARPVPYAFLVERLVTAKYPWMASDDPGEPSS
jgi:transcriptional regulator with XRE-family HTH domain